MGTRHFIGVVLEGELHVAQYGQYDGYPEGQGAKVLDFLENCDTQVFRNKVRACRFLEPEEQEALYAQFEGTGGITTGWEHTSVRAGAVILDFINDSDAGLLLDNWLDFPYDSLFCEYAYVLDLDNEVLEFYKGFNHDFDSDCGRFHTFPESVVVSKWVDHTTYAPVRLVATYPFSNLPDVDKLVEDSSDPEDYDE